MSGRGEAEAAIRTPGHSGYALPAVLVFLGIVAALSAGFVGEARLELDMQRTLRDRTSLETLAKEVALGFAPSWLEGSGEDRISFSCISHSYVFSLAFQRQDSLIDLNLASAEEIAAALGGQGIPSRIAGEVAADIVRFRSYDPHDRLDALQGGIVGGAKRGRFETVEELADFTALASVELPRLRQVFTVRRRMGGAPEGDADGMVAVEVRVVARDGRAADFGAILSFAQVSRQAHLIDIFDPDGEEAVSSPGARRCPEETAALVTRLADAAEQAR